MSSGSGGCGDGRVVATRKNIRRGMDEAFTPTAGTLLEHAECGMKYENTAEGAALLKAFSASSLRARVKRGVNEAYMTSVLTVRRARQGEGAVRDGSRRGSRRWTVHLLQRRG